MPIFKYICTNFLSLNPTQKLSLVKFAPKNKDGFFDTLKERIDSYFKENNLDMVGDSSMKWKSVAMLAIYLVPFAFVLSGYASMNLWIFYGTWVLMGIGMVGIGCAVMHDSNHDSYSNNKTINKNMGKLIMLVGGYDINWRIQHNILHHTYTNIDGLDQDIDAGIFLRFSTTQKRYGFHKFQHWYAWLLYGMMTLLWSTSKDFQQLKEYNQLGLLRKEKMTYRYALTRLLIYKILYYIITLGLPLMFSGAAWYHVVIAYLAMHYVAGLSLSCIFQLAHVMGDCEFPKPTEERKIENSWAIHQLLNTANFSPNSAFLNWFIGGLNRQIEHHLFPYISHIHYKNIAPIVKATALEFNIPYYEQKTFFSALVEHGRLLKSLGKA